jgi:hypothetical protein
LDPIGTLVIDSTPPAIVMSQTPDWMRLAAKWIACWLEPHCRSTVVAGVVNGKPAASHALRAMFRLCSPAWLTHPKTTSSTCSGLMPERLMISLNTSEPRTTG